jgi:hypothetical protein
MEEKTPINELKISQKEIETLMSCNPDVRYQYTIKRIADTETLWTLGVDNQTFAIQKSGEDYLLPIWSSKEFAIIFGSTFMKEYNCFPISLDNFEESIIDIICENGYLLNVFPTQTEEIGKVVGINSFSEDLSAALSEYN